MYKHIQELKEQDIFDVTHFQEKISSIIKCNSTKINREPKLWWSEALTKCYQEKCEARKIYNRNATRTNLIALNRSEAVFKKTKKKEKKDNFIRLNELISPQTSSSEAWSIIRRLKGYKTKTNNGYNLITENKRKRENF